MRALPACDKWSKRQRQLLLFLEDLPKPPVSDFFTLFFELNKFSLNRLSLFETVVALIDHFD